MIRSSVQSASVPKAAAIAGTPNRQGVSPGWAFPSLPEPGERHLPSGARSSLPECRPFGLQREGNRGDGLTDSA